MTQMKRCQQSRGYALCGRPAAKRIRKANGKFKNVCDLCFERWAKKQMEAV